VGAQSGAAGGKSIFEANCAACHATGVAGAPKAGDKAAWAERIKQGAATLHEHALQGKGAMPPKGGNMSLSDADVKAAADYMIGLAK
jgi:cytochrome c5